MTFDLSFRRAWWLESYYPALQQALADNKISKSFYDKQVKLYSKYSFNYKEKVL